MTIGEQLYLEGKFKEAFPEIEKSALKGEPRAVYIIARYYEDGYDTVKTDHKEKEKWYSKTALCDYPPLLIQYSYNIENNSKAEEISENIFLKAIKDVISLAESNDIFAMTELGYMYDWGFGVEQDCRKAAEWYSKAAVQGHARAQCNLGYMYENGYGVEQDHQKAVEWYSKAAVQGHAAAQYNLGYMYENGYGVEQNHQKAAEWFTKSADQGFETAQRKLKHIYMHLN